MALLLLQPPPAAALLLHPPRRIVGTRARGAVAMQADERWAIMQQPGDTAPLPRLELELDRGGSGPPPREPPSGGGDGGGGGDDDESGGGRRDLPWAATQWALQRAQAAPVQCPPGALPAMTALTTMATLAMRARTMITATLTVGTAGRVGAIPVRPRRQPTASQGVHRGSGRWPGL